MEHGGGGMGGRMFPTFLLEHQTSSRTRERPQSNPTHSWMALYGQGDRAVIMYGVALAGSPDSWLFTRFRTPSDPFSSGFQKDSGL